MLSFTIHGKQSNAISGMIYIYILTNKSVPTSSTIQHQAILIGLIIAVCMSPLLSVIRTMNYWGWLFEWPPLSTMATDHNGIKCKNFKIVSKWWYMVFAFHKWVRFGLLLWGLIRWQNLIFLIIARRFYNYHINI